GDTRRIAGDHARGGIMGRSIERQCGVADARRSDEVGAGETVGNDPEDDERDSVGCRAGKRRRARGGEDCFATGSCAEENLDEAIEICAGGAKHADGRGGDGNQRRDDFESGVGFIWDAWAAADLLLSVQSVSEGGFEVTDSGATTCARASTV